MGDEVPNELDPEGEREKDVHPEQKRHPEYLAGGLGIRVEDLWICVYVLGFGV